MTLPDINSWLELDPYGLCAQKKSEIFTRAMKELTEWHFYNCFKYSQILNLQKVKLGSIKEIEDVPFIPVRLFKEFDLISMSSDKIFKVMTSSGTTGQQVSKIYLDKEAAAAQSKILAKLVGCVLGKRRLPMLIIDSPGVLKNRNEFSARGAGILGFSMFGKDVTYALDESMSIDINGVEEFLVRHKDTPIFIFGFTFMIWQYFVLPLQQKKIKLALNNAIILHGGGWKKLQDQAVSNIEFKAKLREVAGIKEVHDYYGMVEQTGSVFIECEYGYLHASVFADVIVRNLRDLTVVPHGEAGVIEVLSILPKSYPGHALLTEDVGVIHGEDNCLCGRLGKYFEVYGRVSQAEIRGCSDTFESNA